MTLLLDTTVLIDTLRARQGRRALLAERIAAGDVLATAAINIAEVYAGMRAEERTVTEGLLSSLKCYPLDETVARRAGALKSAYARKGCTLALADTIVAATALEHGLSLMTDNRRDFPQPELKFYDLP